MCTRHKNEIMCAKLYGQNKHFNFVFLIHFEFIFMFIAASKFLLLHKYMGAIWFHFPDGYYTCTKLPRAVTQPAQTRGRLGQFWVQPSPLQRITSGLNTNFTLSPGHSFHKSSYHKSCVFFLAYLYSAGTQNGNLHPGGWPVLFCGPTQEPVLATANTGKNRERFWKKMKVNGPEG